MIIPRRTPLPSFFWELWWPRLFWSSLFYDSLVNQAHHDTNFGNYQPLLVYSNLCAIHIVHLYCKYSMCSGTQKIHVQKSSNFLETFKPLWRNPRIFVCLNIPTTVQKSCRLLVNFPYCPEVFKTVQKSSRLSEIWDLSNSPEIFPTVRKALIFNLLKPEMDQISNDRCFFLFFFYYTKHIKNINGIFLIFLIE